MPRAREQIGASVENRPLIVHHAGSESAPTRVLIIAGQHGDEPLAREAAGHLVDAFQSSDIQIAALLDANPDGSYHNQRKNAGGIDLNRDHQRLTAPETQAIHAFARRWRPHLIIDVHTYPPRRKHLLQRGLVHANDVFIDIANNPTACEQAAWSKPLRDALPHWIEAVRQQGLRCDRYTIITKSGRVRHSTPDVVDARNGLSLAHGMPTVLLEGREPTRFDDAGAPQRTIDGLLAALHAVVQSDLVRWPSKAVESVDDNSNRNIPIRSRYVESPQRRQLEFLNRDHQSAGNVILPGPYSPELRVTHRIETPAAYLIPCSCRPVLELLRRHGIDGGPLEATDIRNARQYVVRDLQSSRNACRPPRRLRTEMRTLTGEDHDFVMIPVTPSTAGMLAVFLEPHSKYALFRYGELGLYPQANTPYAVLRLDLAKYRSSNIGAARR